MQVAVFGVGGYANNLVRSGMTVEAEAPADGTGVAEIVARHGLADDHRQRAAASRAVKSRPRSSGMPKVSKYFGATQLMEMPRRSPAVGW